MAFFTRAEKQQGFLPLRRLLWRRAFCWAADELTHVGTDKTASEQLLNDVSNIVSVQPKRKDPIDYKPRPDLVRPAPGEQATLPAPQESAANSTTNPDWPNSPSSAVRGSTRK